ncbi:MAG: response regulator [Oryzomonas sp.]|jgi:C4-dicarboxylate-specific signal transduction histidine kinase
MVGIGEAIGSVGERIIIAEDSPTQAEQLKYILERRSYGVSIARDGKAALAMMEAESPALIISDIVMPEMDGYELCRRIKSHLEWCNIPIILLTSLSDPQDVIKGLECGADNFITKPYDEDELVSRIKYLLANRYEKDECAAQPDLKIAFSGQEYAITAGRRQILDLLLSTYETAIRKNNELIRARDELNGMNDQLEERVRERTAELSRTMELLRAETAERLRTAEELRHKDRIMMQQGRQAAMGEMIGNIAHQWRQPLNTLGLHIQKLELYYELGSFSKELLTDTVSESMFLINHMSQTIDDFRNFFKPEKEKTNFNVNEVIRKTISLVEDSLKAQMISVDIDTEDDVQVNGYPNEYSQVIVNILMNARDAFCERMIDDGRIAIKSYVDDGKAVVTITDNAGGIPGEIIEKIFDPYFSTKGPDKGTGIGLNMAKNIIETNMNGRVTVRNIGNGAEFRIEV